MNLTKSRPEKITNIKKKQIISQTKNAKKKFVSLNVIRIFIC